MKNDFPATIKFMLEDCIRQSSKIIPQIFCHNPGSDFTKSYKMPLEDLLHFLIVSGGGTLNTELLKFCHFNLQKRISRSGFVQQREKLMPEGVRFVFSLFNERLPHTHKFKGKYTLVAVDGSDVNIPYNPSQTATFNPPDDDHYKGFNTIHLNALYDISDHIYLDATIGNGPKGKNERAAFYQMIDRYPKEDAAHTIFLADRGYSGYNSFAHVMEKGAFFVFRVKDVDVSRGILASYNLPKTEEFDVDERRFLTKGRYSRIMAQQKEVYHYIHNDIRFDYIDSKKRGLYYMPLRITRIQVEAGKYECLVSNLPWSFSAEELKELYHLRWGIETSFRELKYNIGMVRFHSRKLDFVLQEIYARMLLFNFCSTIAMRVRVKRGRKPRRKYQYSIDFSSAVTICREFLGNSPGLTSASVMCFIAGCIHAVSAGRQYERHIRAQHYITFNNRIG